MPAVSPKQYGFMQMKARGGGGAGGPSPAVAKEFVDATPPDIRSKFAKVIAKKRGKHVK